MDLMYSSQTMMNSLMKMKCRLLLENKNIFICLIMIKIDLYIIVYFVSYYMINTRLIKLISNSKNF